MAFKFEFNFLYKFQCVIIEILKVLLTIFCCHALRTSKYCHSKRSLIGLEDNNIFVEVASSEKVSLQCHFCNEPDDHQSKLWFKKSRSIKYEFDELELDISNNADQSTFYVTSSHSLIINKPEEPDEGFYKCHRSSGDEVKYKFHYLVDVSYTQLNNIVDGNTTALQLYENKYIIPLNDKYKTSTRDIPLSFQFYLEWTEWSPCDACNRPQGEAVRSKIGKCVLRIITNEVSYFIKISIDSAIQQNSKASVNDSLYSEIVKIYLLSNYPISCRSMLLSHVFPALYKASKNIADFELLEHCEETCNPAANDAPSYKPNKKNPFKYKKRRILKAGSFLALVCPESLVSSLIEWTRNGKAIENSKNSPEDTHLQVDIFGSLFMKNVTEDESGTYVCSINGEKIMQTIILVINETPIISKALARHFYYLTAILVLCLTCYCTALIIACKDKDSVLRGVRTWMAYK